MFSIDARPSRPNWRGWKPARLGAQRRSAGRHQWRARASCSSRRRCRSRRPTEARAAARNAAAAVKTAEAAVATARLNVEYAQIRAPIAGRSSRANVTLGNLVGVGDPVLTTLVARDKVHAWFDVSEQAWLRGAASSNAAPQVEMALADERLPARRQRRLRRQPPQPGHRRDPRARAVRQQGAPFRCQAVRALPGGSSPVRQVLTPDRAIGTDQTKRYYLRRRRRQERAVPRGAAGAAGRRRHAHHRRRPEGRRAGGGQRPAARVRPGAPVQAQVLTVDARRASRSRTPPPGAAPTASAPAEPDARRAP